MESAKIIKIANPSKEITSFIEKMRKDKDERLSAVCAKYRKLVKE